MGPRWLQFKLSTWLVLIGIAAWMMALRPQAFLVMYDHSGWRHETGTALTTNYWSIGASSTRPNRDKGFVVQIGPNPELQWPALALLGFLGWKRFVLIRKERANRRGQRVLE